MLSDYTHLLAHVNSDPWTNCCAFGKKCIYLINAPHPLERQLKIKLNFCLRQQK